MNKVHPASFRDPNGFVYFKDGQIYRRILPPYFDNYQRLMTSGLYTKLTDRGLLVKHSEIPEAAADCKTIQPEVVPFVSYPYEWSFSQLKDAALLTLEIQDLALQSAMTLKDASAYNVQFFGSKPKLIDTLSFETYQDGSPWVAYRQFCQHFLAPLALMSNTHIGLSRILQTYIDGVPLDLASSMLPFRTWFKFGLLFHVHLHAKSQQHYANKGAQTKPLARKIPLSSLRGLIDGLKSCVQGLSWKAGGTEWADYYNDTNYTEAGAKHKHEVVSSYIKQVGPKVAWDLGANNGEYSRLACELGAYTIAFDIDPAAVEYNYLQSKKTSRQMLPLTQDLTCPSPSIGWANAERDSMAARGPADLVMALALIHHLAISNNTPLPHIAKYFASLGKHLIIEFVPKEDSQVQRLLSSRQDIFNSYDQKSFENAFDEFFEVKASQLVRDSKRTLYLLRTK